LLSNRVAIITGGASGIGRGIALKFAEEGCSTVIVDMNEAVAKKTIAEIAGLGRPAFYISCDVSLYFRSSFVQAGQFQAKIRASIFAKIWPVQFRQGLTSCIRKEIWKWVVTRQQLA
jgi:NAD(P)-dependent dehydrogenase (short-subunit alcohol dehydrogenase family)